MAIQCVRAPSKQVGLSSCAWLPRNLLKLLLLLAGLAWLAWGPLALAAEADPANLDPQPLEFQQLVEPSVGGPNPVGTLLQVAQQANVREALAAVQAFGSVQNLTPSQRSALSAYLNPLVDTVYSLTFAQVGPQLGGPNSARSLSSSVPRNLSQTVPPSAVEAGKRPVHPMQASWQNQWQQLRPLLVGGTVDGLPSMEDLLARLKHADMARSLALAVTQVDKALQGLKPNSTVRTEQLMFRLNALYIVLEGQVAKALQVELDFSGRPGGQEELEPEVILGPEVEELVPESQGLEKQSLGKQKSKNPGSKNPRSKKQEPKKL